MSYFVICLFIVWVVVVCVFIASLIKNDTTFNNRLIIISAISAYHDHCLTHRIDWDVDFCDMEDYDDTYKRFWDFGYKRILPKDKFDIVKPFIKL